MKKVRFETPNKGSYTTMDESECQSPRPFLELERQAANAPNIYQPQRIIYTNDPVHRFECSDSSPYPLAKKTLLSSVGDIKPNWSPSSELNLSMLDSYEPRVLCRPSFEPKETTDSAAKHTHQPKVLTSIENEVTPPNVLCKDDSFFIRRTNLAKYQFDINPLDQKFNKLGLDKENDPQHKKAEMTKAAVVMSPFSALTKSNVIIPQVAQNQKNINNGCMCHHCNVQKSVPCFVQPVISSTLQANMAPSTHACQCHCQPQVRSCSHREIQIQRNNECDCTPQALKSPKNSVDKKTWAIEKYEESHKEPCLEVEKQTNIAKEKREPTISDLVKIIKLQNEQLQLLQEKVDKFILASNNNQQIQAPVQNYLTEQVALQTVDSTHKISIGVMTSFEMVRTSTVINQEILTQTVDNAQIQCNRSQISIKEVVSNQPLNINFLDGITPISKASQVQAQNTSECNNQPRSNVLQFGNGNEEKTLNEFSLYNVQVDSATTPLMSPDQSLYLDVRDYSDSDSSDGKSNVGWTYYNKVMTHVNGMLQDSDMPSSASALYRNTRQQCMQMQIDKDNVSVAKRVKFGDDPLGIHQRHMQGSSTDTSLKMNQLAAKYLKTSAPQRIAKPPTNSTEMSFATRNYMERHKILQGSGASRSPPPGELPRFLDITALKQQTKLL